jgi:hypothetical protein
VIVGRRSVVTLDHDLAVVSHEQPAQQIGLVGDREIVVETLLDLIDGRPGLGLRTGRARRGNEAGENERDDGDTSPARARERLRPVLWAGGGRLLDDRTRVVHALSDAPARHVSAAGLYSAITRASRPSAGRSAR